MGKPQEPDRPILEDDRPLSRGSWSPRHAVERMLSLARGQRALAFEITRRVSNRRDGDGPVHLGNVR
jgi:hypothetical protein